MKFLLVGDFMPNWCSNSLQLTAASKEEADELHKHFENQDNDDNWTFNLVTLFQKNGTR